MAGLIVATRPGDGFEGPFLLAPWGDTTVIGHLVAQARDWPVDAVLVVLGAAAEEVLAASDLGDVTVVIDPEWREGIAASLRAGVDTVTRLDDYDAIVVAYGDQPLNPPDVVSRLLDTHREAGRLVTVPKYRYSVGGPYVVGAGLWSRLMGLEGETTPEQLFQAHADWVEEVWFDRVPPRRIVTPDDLYELRRRG
ncbi:MAG: nucleotidyltransferase family protein [Acidimicrobiia bacterium]